MTVGTVRYPAPRLAAQNGVLVAGDIAAEDANIQSTGGRQPPGGNGYDDPNASRKHRAKRFNEQIKSGYSVLNTLAAAVVVTGFINPTILGQPLPYGLDTPGLVSIGVFLHLVGQGLILFLTRREE